MFMSPELKKAHEEAKAAADEAIDRAQKAYEEALDTRRAALESLLDCYASATEATGELRGNPEFAGHFQTLAKSHLVSMHTQGLLLAQELDGPEYLYQQRLREITQRRKDLLGY